MSRLLGLSLSLSIVTLILGSTHYYIWTRLVRDVGLPGPWHLIATLVLAFLGTSLPVGMIIARFVGGPLARMVGWVAFVWMGIFFFLLCLVAATDLLRLLTWAVVSLAPGLNPPDAARRLFLGRMVAGSVAALAGGAAITALRTVRAGPEVVRVPVRLKRLPTAMHGFKMVQISDLHVAPLLGRDYVEQVVARTNAVNPDVIVITGDLVDGSVDDLREAIDPLRNLKAPHGVYFVTGNHEYYSGVDQWLAHVQTLGIRVLRNERVMIGAGSNSFDLAGVDDLTARAFGGGHGADLPKALAGRNPERELVLLAHQPRAIYEAAEHNVGLMLSGHTHGGQLWPFGYLVRLQQPYVQGLAQHGTTQIYVNRGTGYWGPPMRLGASPELTLIELHSALS